MHSETLRLAFATQEYVTENYFDGGIANYTHRVAKTLAGMGHDVHVVTRSEIDETDFQHDGVTVHRVMVSRSTEQLNRLTRYRFPTAIYLLGLSTQIYRKLKLLHFEKPFHLVQFPNCPYCGLVSICFLGVPHVLRASSYQSGWNDLRIERKLDFAAVALLEKLQACLSHHIFTPSRILQQTLKKEAGLNGVRVIRTPIYVETSNWDYCAYDATLSGRKYLLYFGRFELRKGFHLLVQALPRLLEKYPDAYVALIGRDMKTQMAPSMAEFARSRLAPYGDRVVILDKLPHNQLYPIIAGAHLVVLPSLVDNLPNACLEAMVLGKVVIGSCPASFEEMIDDGTTGFLVPVNDHVGLADKIVAVWKDPRLQQIGLAAQQRASDFSPEKTVGSLLSYYHEVTQTAQRNKLQQS